MLRRMIEWGNPLRAATKELHLAIITNNLLKALSQHATQSGMNDEAWSSQEWKAGRSMDDRTGQPVVTSWGKTHESQLSICHEKTQHDGTAKSIVNEAIPRDRPGQPVVDPQRGARPPKFIIGNDETELELSV